MKEKLKYAFWIFLPFIIGSLVGFLISGSMDYQDLVQPPFAPPSIVFPIAWTILYILIGIAYFLFRKTSDDLKTRIIYYIQLFFNALWSIIFFVWKMRLFSIIWIMILLLLIILLIYQFYQYKKISAYLLIPYLLWVVFATYLNIGIYVLN